VNKVFPCLDIVAFVVITALTEEAMGYYLVDVEFVEDRIGVLQPVSGLLTAF